MGKVSRRDRERIQTVLDLLKGVEGAMSARVMLPDMCKVVTVWRDAKVTLTDTPPSADSLDALPSAERRLIERFRAATPRQRREALRGLYALDVRDLRAPAADLPSAAFAPQSDREPGLPAF